MASDKGFLRSLSSGVASMVTSVTGLGSARDEVEAIVRAHASTKQWHTLLLDNMRKSDR